ncbi:MAG: 4Fe-4S binding protein [Chloroflexota bacterium]|nr:4Fe-4S binding protein [Chloroflexota bacterium]
MVTKQSIAEMRSRGVVKLKEKDMFALWVKTACGNLTSRQLNKLAEITEKYARGYLLFTTRQIPIIPFVSAGDVEKVQAELATVYLRLDRCGPTVRNVNVCYDDKICPEAVTNSLSLGEKLDRFFDVPMRHKVKIGISGCRKDCVICRALTDIGFIGVERDGRRGYDVYVGGRLGLNPFVGVKMAECLTEEESVRFVQNYFDLLSKEGKLEERGADLIPRLGVEKVRQELTKNLSQSAGLQPVTCETRLREKATDKVILRIRATAGEVTATQLRKISAIADKYGRGFVHFAVRGSPEIPCIDKKDGEDIRQELRAVGMSLLDGGIDNLQSCFGSYCTESNADPQSLLREIERLVEELGLNNQAINISAGGCPNSCAIVHLSDIGFYGVVEPEVAPTNCNGCQLCVPVCKRKAIAVKGSVAVIDRERCGNCGQCITICPLDAIAEKRRGFAVLAGGREGEDTRLGELIAEFLSEEEALRLAESCLRLVKEKRASVADIIDEIGIEKFKEMLLSAQITE